MSDIDERLDLGSEEQSMTKLRIGPFLKKVRQEKQMTLRAVEEATDKEISNAYLSQLESGKIANPSPHVLYTLSLVFGVAYETLMERAGYIMPAPNRLAPVEDEELVEIAAHFEAKFDGWPFNVLERLTQDLYRLRAREFLAAIRPHIEAAERERCAKDAEGKYEKLEPASQKSKDYKNGRLAAAAAIRSGK